MKPTVKTKRGKVVKAWYGPWIPVESIVAISSESDSFTKLVAIRVPDSAFRLTQANEIQFSYRVVLLTPSQRTKKRT